MLKPQVLLILANVLLLAIANLPVAAQTAANSSTSKISTVESWQRQTTQQGNAEILGTIELGTQKERRTPPVRLQTRAIEIKPQQRDLFTPRPVTPAEADARIDQGIQVIIDNP